ncbi:MAG: SDR family oxidoreductase [Chloroflexi bacterium]|nr:SDR family oxidoreductase [Chloroflexota bacterium]
MERLRLDGRTAIVAGAGGGGIGTATSLTLAEAGADIVAVDIDAERVEDTKRRVGELGRKCLGIVADIRQKADVERVVSQAVKEFGAVHYVANVAGGMKDDQWGEVLEYGERQFDEVISLNLRYAFLVCQAAARSMVELGIKGSMVSVASVSGLAGAPYHGPYGAAKAGLMALTRTMAVELGPRGIRVNAVAPGSVKTPRVMAMASRDIDESSKTTIPIGKPCEPDDIAAGILFLLSDLARSVSGHTLVIDGGATAKFSLTGRTPEQIEEQKQART